MINFIKHCIRYWTHIRPIEIEKNGLLEPDVWYEVSFWVRLNGNSKTNGMWFDELRIRKDDGKSLKATKRKK